MFRKGDLVKFNPQHEYVKSILKEDSKLVEGMSNFINRWFGDTKGRTKDVVYNMPKMVRAIQENEIGMIYDEHINSDGVLIFNVLFPSGLLTLKKEMLVIAKRSTILYD